MIRRMVKISDSQKYTFNKVPLDSNYIRWALDYFSFAALRGLSAAVLWHIVDNLPYRENVIKPDKNTLFETSKCFLLR